MYLPRNECLFRLTDWYGVRLRHPETLCDEDLRAIVEALAEAYDALEAAEDWIDKEDDA